MDTTIKVTEVENGLISGETVTGRTVRGMAADNNSSVGQYVAGQKSNGNWASRRAVYKSG